MLRLNKDGFPGNPIPQLRTPSKHREGSLSRSPRSLMLARRDAACTRILVLLKAGPTSAAALSEVLSLTIPTTSAYLRYMAIDLRSVRRIGARDELKRELWALGEDVMMPTRDQLMDSSFEQRRRTVPAKQVGMWRDGLVAALFGAPGGGAAA
jgi:hypothetical protein